MARASPGGKSLLARFLLLLRVDDLRGSEAAAAPSASSSSSTLTTPPASSAAASDDDFFLKAAASPSVNERRGAVGRETEDVEADIDGDDSEGAVMAACLASMEFVEEEVEMSESWLSLRWRGSRGGRAEG
jgi:hypothetical protein